MNEKKEIQWVGANVRFDLVEGIRNESELVGVDEKEQKLLKYGVVQHKFIAKPNIDTLID